MSVLLFLYENGPSNRTSIYNNISRNYNMSKRLDHMVDMGLLTTTASIGGTVLCLTKRGCSIAEHLSMIERDLGNLSS